MGITVVTGTVWRPDEDGRRVAVRLLVDTGALYTVLPEPVWRTLRLEPLDSADFGLADGTSITRALSEGRFEISGRTATSPVVLGERDDAPLLGAVTLETLRLMVNPMTRKLVPMRFLPLRHAGASGGEARHQLP